MGPELESQNYPRPLKRASGGEKSGSSKVRKTWVSRDVPKRICFASGTQARQGVVGDRREVVIIGERRSSLQLRPYSGTHKSRYKMELGTGKKEISAGWEYQSGGGGPSPLLPYWTSIRRSLRVGREEKVWVCFGGGCGG